MAAERNRMMKAMSVALRELTKQTSFTHQTRDLAAFLVLALDSISVSIERSVLPWEKRDYWVKADRFRMDWAWVEPLRLQLRKAVEGESLDDIAIGAATLAVKLKNIKVSEKHRLGSPWQGAWGKLNSIS
ncbi:MAG: hypothetical protein WD740_08515 [Anaerolineales bacterium]